MPPQWQGHDPEAHMLQLRLAPVWQRWTKQQTQQQIYGNRGAQTAGRPGGAEFGRCGRAGRGPGRARSRLFTAVRHPRACNDARTGRAAPAAWHRSGRRSGRRRARTGTGRAVQTLVDRGRPAGQFARGGPARQGDAGACEARARADAVAERCGYVRPRNRDQGEVDGISRWPPVPGAETTTQRPPSYFGLSISVPTNDKSIIPSIPAPFGKSE